MIMKNFAFISLLIFLNFSFVQSQDVKYAHYVVDTLGSPFLYGRGYTHDGARNAALFISNEFKKFNLNSFNNSYFQNYDISINTFPSELSVKVGNKNLKSGTEFMVALSSQTVKGKYKVVKIDSTVLKTKSDLEKIKNKKFRNKVVIIDKQNIKDSTVKDFIQQLRYKNPFQAAGLAFISDNKLSWSVSDGRKLNDYFKISLLREALPKKIKRIEIDIQAQFQKDYQVQNVVGYIKGKVQPDSFYVFTAHYDHLGEMGKDVYFPGANDNASGTAMVLNLAKYFSENISKIPDYSIAFALFSGEEAGLFGSTFMAENPVFSLSNIKTLINLDMVGTGSEGITIVNGNKFDDVYKKLEKINNANSYLKKVAQRGESCNSDHCPFYEKGVKAIFIFAMGSEFTEYHNVFDIPQKLPFTKYNEIFNLLTDFVNEK